MKIKTLNELILEKSCYPINIAYKKFCIEEDFSDRAINEVRESYRDRHWMYLVDALLSSLFLSNLNVFRMFLEEFQGKEVSDKVRTEVYREILAVSLMQNNKEIKPEAISIFSETTGISVKEFVLKHDLTVYAINNIERSPLQALLDYSNNPFFEDVCLAYRQSVDLHDIFSFLNSRQETTHMATWLLSDFDCRKFIISLSEKDCDFYDNCSYLLLYLTLSNKYQWKTDDISDAINFKSYENLSLIDDYLVIDDELDFLSMLASSLMNDLYLYLSPSMIDYSKSDEYILEKTSKIIEEYYDVSEMHKTLNLTLTMLNIRKRKARIQSIIDSWLKGNNFPKVFVDRITDFEQIAKFLKIIHVDFDIVKFQELVNENLVTPSIEGEVESLFSINENQRIKPLEDVGF
ncbi:hypothetical protein BS054_27585 [Vibrio parahaemolyticus]|nr:hypothetical protein [Vibrio parahaemolyticus]